MDRATEGDLPLDVDHLTAADAHARGDAARLAEGVATEREDAEAVDLTDLLTAGIDKNYAAVDRLLHERRHAVLAALARGDGAVDVDGVDDRVTGLARPEIGLTQEVGKRADV